MNLNQSIGNWGASSRRRKFFWAVLIALLAVGLRARMAAIGPVEWDEPVYLDAAVEYAQDIRGGNWNDFFNTQYNFEHPVLNKLIYGVALSARPIAPDLSGNTVPADTLIRDTRFFTRLMGLRLISVLFGGLLVFFLALLNPLAGLFLAVDTYAVKYSSVIYLEALPLFLSFMSVTACEIFRKKEDPGEPFSIKRSAWLWVSAAVMGLALSAKYIYGLPALAILLSGMSIHRKNLVSRLKPALLWVVIALAVFFLVNYPLWHDPLGQILRTVSFHLDYSLHGASVVRKAYPFWQPLAWLAIPIPWQPLQLQPFFIRPGDFPIAIDTLFLPLAAVGFWRMVKTRPIYALWLGLGLAFLLIWNTKWPQYILLILPPYCLSAGLGVQVLWEWVRSRRKARTVPAN